MDITVNNVANNEVRFSVIQHLRNDAMLGQAFQKLHKNIIIEHEDSKKDFNVVKHASCALPKVLVVSETYVSQSAAKMPTIALKFRKYNKADRDYIGQQIATPHEDDIIETICSPWRAQIVVVRADGKFGMCLDYSQATTLNSELDAYPFSCIDDLVHKLAEYVLFSMFDLPSMKTL